MLSCCPPAALRLMIEWELRRGTALSLSLPRPWTQPQSSTATPRRKVCLYLWVLFGFKSLTLYNPQLLTYSQWEQDSHSALTRWMCVRSVPVTHGCFICDMFVFLYPSGSRSLSSIASLESPVICCLGPLIQYLQEFNLERVLRSERYLHTQQCRLLFAKKSLVELKRLDSSLTRWLSSLTAAA